MLTKTQEQISLKEFKEKVINDYRTVSLSREISVMGRRDVLSGKGKFGIFGDGKELPLVVLSHFFKNGDFSGGFNICSYIYDPIAKIPCLAIYKSIIIFC